MLCLVLTPIYPWKVSSPKDRKNKAFGKHLFLSTLAFVIWVYATSGEAIAKVFAINSYSAAIASIVLIGFTLVSGVIKMEDKAASQN